MKKSKREFVFDIQRFFGGTSTEIINEPKTVPDATPEETEMQRLQLAYAKNLQPSVYAASDLAYQGLIGNQINPQPDWNAMYQQGQSGLSGLLNDWQGLQRGEVPQAMQDARIKAANYGLSQTMGTQVNDLVNRGVMDSSVASKALTQTGLGVGALINSGYTQDLQTASGLLNQGQGLVTAPIGYAATAQEAAMNAPAKYYAMASGTQAPTTDSWKTLLGARYSLASDPTAVVTESPNILGPLLGGVGSFLGAACFVGKTNIATPNGPKKIQDLYVGSSVMGTKDGKLSIEKIVKIMPEKMALPITVVTDQGKVISTNTQPFFTEEGQKDLLDIKVEDKLEMMSGTFSSILAIAPALFKEKVYDLTVSGDNIYFAEGFKVPGGEY